LGNIYISCLKKKQWKLEKMTTASKDGKDKGKKERYEGNKSNKKIFRLVFKGQYATNNYNLNF